MANVWRDAIPTSTVSSDETPLPGCERYYVPAGTLVFYDEEQQATVSIVVESTGAYIPECTGGFDLQATSGPLEDLGIGGPEEPFYGSVIPIAYTISATTIVTWLLLILLLIAQKRRPWFQQFMVLFVAVSLTVFLARTTRFLEYQYMLGYHDAEELRHHIFGSLSFRILEVFSVLIIWLAHLQVLLRLFDRTKEKTVIKWMGVTLAVIDTVFWCLVNFLVPYRMDNHLLSDIIPVFAYLFQITIQVVYAGAVIIYSFRKRKFAYHHTALITAIISICAVLMPLIFFILDLAEYWITGWSEFIRWVTDAAASVVVWEWVDVIERLEKEHQKTGVLGRQIYEDERSMNFRHTRAKSHSSNSNGNNTSNNTSSPSTPDNTNNPNNSGVKRSIIPSVFRPKNRWVVSRASSTNSAHTTYGNEIQLSSMRQTSFRPVSETSDEAARSSSTAPQQPVVNTSSPLSTYIPAPVVRQPSIHTYTPIATPSEELAALPLNTSPVRVTPVDDFPADPQNTPPPLKRHMHPLRKSSRKSHTITSVLPEMDRASPQDQSMAAGPSSKTPEVPPNPEETDEDEYTYTVIRSDGFDLQPSSSRQSANSRPPSFVPAPGFQAGDYWDEKRA